MNEELITSRDQRFHPQVRERVSNQERQSPFKDHGNIQEVRQVDRAIFGSQRALKATVALTAAINITWEIPQNKAGGEKCDFFSSEMTLHSPN